MQIKKYLIFLLFIYCQYSGAQTLTGTVINKKRQPIDWASVILKDDRNEPITFTHSDEKGAFSITIPQGKSAKTINILMIGYKTQSISIDHFSHNEKIILEENTFTLKEVKVKPVKIQRSGDTLTYNVLAFKQKQDRSIADVIAKMPGLQVSSNGQISYQGKSINKFYIEGMDLLGNKYAEASENLSANKVDKVQVLENHQPIRVLRNTNFSEQAALNIVLKDDARNVWQGTADIGSGLTLQKSVQWLRNLRLTDMFFSRRMQSISMYKNNNTGKNIEHEVSDLIVKTQSLSEESGLLQNIYLDVPSLDEKRYSFNDTHIFATNWLFKTKKDNQLRLQVNGLVDKNDQEQQSSTTFLDINGNGSLMTEQQQVHAHRNEWKTELLYERNNDNVYLSNHIKGYLDFDYSNGNSTVNGNDVQQHVTPRQRYIADNFNLIQKLKNDKSISISSQIMYSYLPGWLLLHDGNEESLGLHSLRWNTYTYFRHKLAGFYVTYRLGFDTKEQHLLNISQNINSKDIYHQYSTYITPSISYETEDIELNASGKLSWLHRNFNSEKKDNFLFEPILFLNYKLTSDIKTILTYSYMWMPSGINDLSASPIYTDYISMTEGLGHLDNTMIHAIRNYWSYRNAISGFFTNADFSYTNLRNAILYSSSYESDYYQRIATKQHSNSNSWDISGKAGKSIGWNKLTLSINGEYGSNHYQLLISDTPADFKLQNAQMGISIAYHPLDFLSIEENSSLNFNHQESKETSISSHLRYFSHDLAVYIMPGHLQIEWKNELYHSNDKTVNTSYFSDLSVSYRKKEFEMGLSCNNIFGTTRYDRRYLDNYEQIYSITRLRPRDLIVHINFDF